jgi:hypothetical protein
MWFDLIRQGNPENVGVVIMVTCQSCGYVSPETSKFCRQCGALLISDGDPMEAATRNYGRQGPAVATAGSTPLPPSIGDAVAGETARYPRPPQASLHVYTPPGPPAAAPDTASLKPKRRLRILKWGAIFMAMMMSMGIGALINEESNSGRVLLERTDEIRLERLRTEDRLRTTMTGSAVEQQERLLREIESRLEAVDRASREAERAAERGEDILAGGEKPLDLAAYEYQGASMGQFSRIPGRELLKQSTKDEFETVSRFYQEKLGKPFVFINERNRKQSLFQIPGTPSVTVLVRQARDRGANQTEILVMRSPFRFPVTETIEVPSAPPAPPPPAPPPAVVK